MLRPAQGHTLGSFSPAPPSQCLFNVVSSPFLFTVPGKVTLGVDT